MPKRSDYIQEIPKFRSRYTDADTSHLLPENQPKPDRPWWWRLCCFLCTCCCKYSRRQIFLSTTILLVAFATLQNASAIRSFVHDNSTALSQWQSYGLIEETNREWMERQAYWQTTRSTVPQEEPLPSEPSDIVSWYESNGKVNFECPHEETIGAHSLCGITLHLSRKRNCLIYTSDPPNRLLLENALRPLIHKTCEIHVFDPTNRTSQLLELIPGNVPSDDVPNNEPVVASLKVHPWGFTTQANSNSTSSKLPLMSISDTMNILNHKGRTIDLFILNCAGCEFELFPELFRLDMMQLLVELHGMQSNTARFFQQAEQNHFVTFHREPTRWSGVRGLAQLYSFLKLRKGFFAPKRIASE